MQKGNTLFYTVVLLGLFVFAAWKFLYTEQVPRVTFPSGYVFNVEVVSTPEKREKGLGGREILRDDHGMLFVFDSIDYHKMWMKDMNFPIDVVWFDENFRVVDITRNISNQSFPNTFMPIKPAGFALEINAGYAKRYGINIGDNAIFEKK